MQEVTPPPPLQREFLAHDRPYLVGIRSPFQPALEAQEGSVKPPSAGDLIPGTSQLHPLPVAAKAQESVTPVVMWSSSGRRLDSDGLALGVGTVRPTCRVSDGNEGVLMWRSQEL